MLRSLELLRGAPVRAVNGAAGHLEDVLFEQETWAVRYLIVDADPGLGIRRILISPMALEPPTPEEREFRVRLTRTQLERTPELDADEPVTRAWEHRYHRAFAWPPYWAGGAGLWGAAGHPIMPAMVPMADPTPDTGIGAGELEPGGEEEEAAAHLHSAGGYRGYHVLDPQGAEVGQVDDFILDDQTWAVAYLAVYTGGVLRGHRVLVPVDCIQPGSWVDSRVNLTVSRKYVENAPPWEPLESLPADYQDRLRRHYGSASVPGHRQTEADEPAEDEDGEAAVSTHAGSTTLRER